MNRRVKTGPHTTQHPTFLRITHISPHFFLTRSYLLCPRTAKPNRGGWLLRSTTTRPAFSRCRRCRHRSKSSVSLRIWSGTASLLLAAAARKPDSGKVCIARGTSISQFSNADRRVSGRLRTAGSLERHQLGRAGSATLTPKNNRESYSCSKAEARLKIAANSTALLACKLQRAKGTKAKGLKACSPLA